MTLLLWIIGAFVLADLLIIAYVFLIRKRRKFSPQALEEIRATWKGIIRQPDYRHAILDADKLLDHALGLLGYSGNLGQKLKRADALFSDVNRVWGAHKERNNIAHRIHYHIDEKRYRATMLAFKQAFKDLHIFE